jgi:hypothetical protein
VATIVEVARGKSKLLSFDVATGVMLHGTTAVAALWLANMAGQSG